MSPGRPVGGTAARDAATIAVRMGTMRIPACVWVIATVCAGCGLGPGAVGTGDASRPVTEQGVSLSLPSGWKGQALQGRLQIRDYADGRWGAPPPGHVWAAIDERSRSFAGVDGLPYPPLTRPLSVRPGQFSSRVLGTGDLGAARLFRRDGRYFELAVVYGDTHPSRSLVDRLNAVLGTLVVRRITHPPAMLQPPTFAAATGWHAGHSPAMRAQPQGDQLCAWASTIRYRDRNPCPIPTSTIRALRAGQMVISIDVYRDWSFRRSSPLPPRLVVPRTVTSGTEGGYTSAHIFGTTRRSTVEIDVYVGFGQPFTTTMRARAQREIDRLRLPRWPAYPA